MCMWAVQHCFAACRFLVFNDFNGSFDAFIEVALT